MDVDGFLEVLRGLRDGRIERRAIDTVEPSAFARGILSAQPYTFLDDAPLEERRTQAVMARRVLDIRTADELGALDPDAIARVREEAWPQPASAEEVHEALLWMGYVTVEEGRPWQPWLDELAAGRRVTCEDGRYFAAEATRDPKAALRGRMEALGPLASDHPLLRGCEEALHALESEGVLLRARVDGREAWCDRRLLARIHRYTLDRLRREIEPVTAAQFLRFLAAWQHVDPDTKLEGPRGVAEVAAQLAGFEVPAAEWEANVLPARVRGYKREWLDQVTLSGELVWGRFWGAGLSPVRRTPLCLVPREDLEAWSSLAAQSPSPDPSGAAAQIEETLRGRGPSFFQELPRAARLPPASVEDGLCQLIGLGRVTCDSFGGLRWMLVPAWRRRAAAQGAGRWSLLRREAAADLPAAEFAARRLLRRTGVIFRKTLTRERLPVFWRDVARACRTLEARGEIRGGRFVGGFDGEQYALPEAVEMLRALRRKGEPGPPPTVVAADPLNFRGILTPDERVSAATRELVKVG
jgi:ATP-dependent Lhr-like helicase